MGRDLRLYVHRKSVHIKLSRIHLIFSVNNVWYTWTQMYSLCFSSIRRNNCNTVPLILLLPEDTHKSRYIT